MLNDEVIAGSYPHPSPVRRYRRSRPPPGYSRSCDPIQEEEMSLGQEGPSRAWHSASDDATDRQALLRQPQVQFLTPRRSDSPSLASEVSHHWGYRVAAAEEELMGLEEPQPPVDRYLYVLRNVTSATCVEDLLDVTAMMLGANICLLLLVNVLCGLVTSAIPSL